jgi:YidC/Oxa1 family membrane protein insertase
MAESGSNKPKPKKELTMEQRLLIAFALTIPIFVLMPYLPGFRPEAPPKQAETKQASPAAPTPTPTPTPTFTPAPAAAKAAKAAKGKASVQTPAQPVAGEKDETFVIETDVYKVAFSNRGAAVRSWILKRYKSTDGKPVDLVSASAAEKTGWPFAYIFPQTQPAADLNKALYRATVEAGGKGIAFEYVNGGVAARKSFLFQDGRYRVEVGSRVESAGAAVYHLLAWRGGFGDRTVHNAPARQQAVFYDAVKAKLVVKDQGDAKSGPVVDRGNFSFGGIQDTYFAALFLPPPGATFTLQTWLDKVTPAAGSEEAPHAGMAGWADGLDRMTVFVGPKDIDTLKRIDPRLESLVDWGWFFFIAKPLFLSLHWVHDHWITNWGWGIVFVTVIINLLMLPLRFANIRSMQKMARLQPQIQALNARYKDVGMRDPRKQQQNEELMALYKKHGVNPMGGCVPLLLQMPFFFAFYKVLSVAIELRGAPWLWVADLSQPELSWFRILPLLMIVTQVVLQKMTPATSPDPTQQRMMLLMPAFLGFLFYTASAGLVLYWLTGNVVGIVQQYFFNKFGAVAVPAAAPAAAPARKKKG